MQTTTASIAIPTRGRPDYLDVALTSVMPQAAAAGADVLVVSDGHDPATEDVVARHGARLLSVPARSGANAARNAAIDATSSELIVFIDDDVEAPSGWLAALLEGTRQMPAHGVFGGPIRARLEGGGPHACGREGAPITTLELGPADRDATLVWSANMLVRREAFELAGRFDEQIKGRGEEEEWERRFMQAGGRIRYVADAGLEHRRSPADARLWPLSRASYALGRTARRYDVHKGVAPSLAGELRTLFGCTWHIARRRCAIGVVMLAQSAGRLREALAGRRG